MTDFKKLKQQLDKMLLQEMSMNEMAMAWVDRQANKCVWVENPNTHNNEYFNYLDSFSYIKAGKVARISLTEPKYLKHSDSKKQWVLTNKEKKELVSLMNKESRVHKGYSNWQATIIQYNFDNFYIDPLDTMEDTYDKNNYPNALNINTTMPDYTKLQ